MRLSRLWRMGPEAVGDRARQEVQKWLERVHPTPPTLPADEVAAQVDRLRDGTGRFFRGARDPRTAAVILERFPDESARLLAAADRLVAGRFDLLGYRDLDFGDPIDWSLDPVSGKRSPKVSWTTLDALDSAHFGDAKVVWELGRHQWLVTLAQAWALSRDPKYAKVALARLDDWMAANPVGIGIHWTSSLEAALRIISWSWTIALLHDAPALDGERLARIVRALAIHANRVERYLSLHYSPNTHLTGEALGLVYAGTVLDALDAAQGWHRRGTEILERQLARQVSADGVYFEQSTCYQRYTLEIALHWRLLGGAPHDARLGKLADFLLNLRRPDGSMPAIGDADGGWLLPLTARAPDDLRGILSTTAAWLGRPELAWAAGGLAPETVWLLGPAATLPAAAPPSRTRSRVYLADGWAILGDGWGADRSQVIFDGGPFGCPHSGGHGHADLLSVQMALGGENIVVDPGTGTYADRFWRDHFRSTAAHSTVVIDQREQAEPDGPFAWKRRPDARLFRWIVRSAFDLALGEHKAWAPLGHRRTVIFHRAPSGARVIILDELTGPGEHSVELGFQLAPGMSVIPRPGACRLEAPHGARVDVLCRAAARSLSARVEDAWVSPDYGQRIFAPRIAFSIRAPFPLRLITVFKCVESPES